MKKVSGHFSAILFPGTTQPTSLVTIRRRHTLEIHRQKQAQLLREIQQLTGKPVSKYARAFDGINRHWAGVKRNNPD